MVNHVSLETRSEVKRRGRTRREEREGRERERERGEGTERRRDMIATIRLRRRAVFNVWNVGLDMLT